MKAYKLDHIKVMKVLGSDVPKRPAFKVSDIVTVGFKGQDNADRRVRNAFRKLRNDDLVEICDRGEYRLLPGGVKQVQQWQKDGWPTGKESAVKTAAKKPAKKAKKAPAKKAKSAKKATPKKAAPKKAKPTKAEAPKKAAPKKAPKKVDMKKAAGKKAPAEGNGVNAKTPPEQGASASQLAF